MSSMVGADPDALDRLAVACEAAAEQLDAARAQLAGLTHSSPWRGEHADQFRYAWDNYHQRSLASVVQGVAGVAKILHDNANQQRLASGEASASLPGADHWVARIQKVPGGPGTNPVFLWLDHNEETTALMSVMVSLINGGTSAMLHAGASELPRLGAAAEKFDKRGGRALGVVSIGIDGVSLVRHLSQSGTSDDTINDEMNVTMDGLTTFAGIDPLSAAIVGGAAAGVSVVEAADPALTADVFRLVNPMDEVDGAVLDSIRKGDYNPLDMGAQVVRDESLALADLGQQAVTGVDDVVSFGKDHVARLLGKI